jgi:hypothetical protein
MSLEREYPDRGLRSCGGSGLMPGSQKDGKGVER